ncbi:MULTISPECIES: iron uptake porin [Nostocales]|uniref:Iron uptake porin n=4 Tax=Nostocales TaxID=1161 RepID=A0A0C1R7B5_9CYAN|nr:iron uptake porin [Tolypothrix bouteillei]KAF3886999.1 iron uptake porin [Tolypothrix bouteillei VB521301]
MRKLVKNVTGALACSYLILSQNAGLAETIPTQNGFESKRVRNTTKPTAKPITQIKPVVSQLPQRGEPPRSGASNPADRVNSVSQLRDVQPTDWAFQALQSLVERYGVIAGYPNGTFRGNRAMTRYEFAAGLNAALARIDELIAASTADLVSRDDLATLQRLQQEFSAELATLRGRVDALEAKTAEIEANQFSTTTKLTGQIVVGVNAGGFDGDRIIDATGQVLATENPNPTISYRAGIDFSTSFFGNDLLLVRIDTGSGTTINTGSGPVRGIDDAAGFLEPTFGSVLDFSVEPPTDADIGIARVSYTFQPFKDLRVSIGPDIRTTDYVDRNSYAYLSFRDFSTQAFTNNYLLFPISGPSSGAAIDWKPGGGAISVRALYAAAGASQPGNLNIQNVGDVLRGTASFIPLLYPVNPNRNFGDAGIFGDTYQGTVELEYAPSRKFALRLQYSGGEVLDNRYDVFGANFELALSSKFAIFGRYGYGNYDDTFVGDIKPNYWMAGVAFPDLFTRGALAGIAAGQPFIANEIGDSTQTNFEAFYNFPISYNIQVTPLIQVITNPSNQESNGTIVTGTLRTVLSF